ncbi:R-phenyllactate dehydratase activator [Oxobacter pfennigii]|uniref:R-phenyllactate dehydratase activator n=1 Tax=Oxobacter pfennigii TaxID=36849 RepID=A0A0N8NT16_9CLOT|nr:acyl-CoA dehydratase activase [Oxobacter pfennigii]KPU43576.1 R-phenyllactate dehydratase activator [Oxobacter pfennigii]
MIKGYLGVDIGSISTKAVVIDENDKLLAETYLWTEGDPIDAVKRVLAEIESQIQSHVQVVSIGTTGSARELIGTILEAQVIKNEITSHAIGTLSIYPEVRTIFEIGGQDSKIIILDKGIVTDYAMNTLCAAGTGSFLSSQSKRLGIAVEEFGSYALRAQNPTKIAGRCTVFAESDLIHKAQIGHKKEDIIAGLCRAVVTNYLNNVGKGKTIKPPIVFQGGVSKNPGVVKAFEEITCEKILVDKNSHLLGSIGAAILAKKSKIEKLFSFNIRNVDFSTEGRECGMCPNNCEIVCVMKNNEFLDGWGNRCERGLLNVRNKVVNE